MTVEAKSNFTGLETNTSRLSGSDGGLDVAHNVVIRKQGVVEPRSGVTAMAFTGTPGAARYKKIWEHGSDVYTVAKLVSSGAIEWNAEEQATELYLDNTRISALGDSNEAYSERPSFFREDMIPTASIRGECYVGTMSGVRAIRTRADGVVRMYESGLFSAMSIATAGSAAGTPAAVANNMKVAYRVVFKRTYLNGLIVRGTPSARAVYSNTSGATSDVSVTIISTNTTGIGGIENRFLFGSRTESGTFYDELEVYRTRSFSVSSEVDEEYALVKVIQGASFTYSTTFVDNMVDSQRGATLYTSPSQGGAVSENQRPPACGSMEVFRGHLFFGNTIGPFRKILKTSAVSTADLYGSATGIGYRSIPGGGDLTAGSPIITGLASTTGIEPGMVVSNYYLFGTLPYLSGHTYVVSVDSANQVTVNNNATNTLANQALSFVDSVQVNGRWFPVFPCTTTPGGVYTGAVPMVSGLAGSANTTISYDPSIYYHAISVTPSIGSSYTFIIEETFRSASGSTATIRATHGSEYDPPIAGYSGTATSMERDELANGIAWSKKDEPEHVPPLNFAYVGDKSKSILGLVSTRDSLFILKEDGIWRLSGSGGNGSRAWRIDPFDMTTLCILPQSIQKLNNRVYFLSNKGVVRLGDGGVEVISFPIQDEVKLVVASVMSMYTSNGYYSINSLTGHSSAVNEIESEYMLSIGSNADEFSGVLVYNELTGAWVTWGFASGNELYSMGYDYPQAMGWSSKYRSVMLCGYTGSSVVKRLTSPEEASAPIASLSGRDDGYRAVTISSAVLVSTTATQSTYTITYTPAAQLAVGDVVVTSADKVWTVSSVTSSTVVEATFPSSTEVPATGAGAYAVGVIRSEVRGRPFMSPMPVQKIWTSAQAMFAKVLGATSLKLTALSNVSSELSDTTAEAVMTPPGLAKANGYAVAHRGNNYKANVPREMARSYALAIGAEINTAFGNWELESLMATSTPSIPDSPTTSHTGSAT